MRFASLLLFLCFFLSSVCGAELDSLREWCCSQLAPAVAREKVEKKVQNGQLKVDFSKVSLTSLGIHVGKAINRKFGVKEGQLARGIEAVVEKYLYEDLKKKRTKDNVQAFYPSLAFEGKKNPKREGSDYEEFEFNYASRALQKLPVTDEKMCKAFLWHVFSNDRAEQIYLQMILLGEVASPATPCTNNRRLKEFLKQEFVDLKVEEWMVTILRMKKKRD